MSRRKMNGLVVGRRLRDRAEELEELGRADDRVGNARSRDRLFLGDLRT